MKLITFVIPSYNSAAYIRRCVDSILPAGEDAEILIINDGSKDETGAIADEYQAKHPSIVRALHFENGGHGEAINRGLNAATGVYFKVVDSDDYLDGESLNELMDTLHEFERGTEDPDVIVTDYVRIRQGTKKRRRMDYWSAFPKRRVFTFSEIRYLGCYQNLFIHCLIFKTALIRESALVLPKHTFYVDCLYSNIPLYYAKTLYYLPVPLYRYILGRVGQSVDRNFMCRNIDQMIAVNRAMIDYYLQNKRPLNEKQEKLLLDDISFIMSIHTAHLVMDGSEEALRKRHAFWQDIESLDPAFTRRMRKNMFGYFSGMKTDAWNPLISNVYKLVNGVYIVD